MLAPGSRADIPSSRILTRSRSLPGVDPTSATSNFIRSRIFPRSVADNLLIMIRPAPMRDFEHERLDVYRVAIEFIALADDVAAALKEGRAYLATQLRRASSSITLNIGEGAGEFSTKDKARFYRMARRSATECAATLDVCKTLQLITAERFAAGRGLLLRIVAMLTAMVLALRATLRARARARARARPEPRGFARPR